MLDNTERMIAFLGGCIPVRLGLAWYASQASADNLRLMGILAFIPALSILLLWFTHSRQVAFEAGGRVWWNELRPAHSLLILIFAITAAAGVQDSWKWLAADTALGLFAYIKK